MLYSLKLYEKIIYVPVYQNIVACRSVSRKRLGKHIPLGNIYACNNRSTLRNGPCKGVIRRIIKANSWKRAAFQRGLKPRSRELAIAKAVSRKQLVKTLRAGKGSM
jgi:hypothetical protein